MVKGGLGGRVAGASTREARRRACRRTYEPVTRPEAGTLPPSPFPCRAVTGATLSSQRQPKSGRFRISPAGARPPTGDRRCPLRTPGARQGRGPGRRPRHNAPRQVGRIPFCRNQPVKEREPDSRDRGASLKGVVTAAPSRLGRPIGGLRQGPRVLRDPWLKPRGLAPELTGQ